MEAFHSGSLSQGVRSGWRNSNKPLRADEISRHLEGFAVETLRIAGLRGAPLLGLASGARTGLISPSRVVHWVAKSTTSQSGGVGRDIVTPQSDLDFSRTYFCMEASTRIAFSASLEASGVVSEDRSDRAVVIMVASKGLTLVVS